MGYKVEESQLASKLNQKFAMYKGEPIFLTAKRIGGNYEIGYAHQLWGMWIKPDTPRTSFRIDISEPSFSAALVQYGYASFNDRDLAFLEPTVNTYRVKWHNNGYNGSVHDMTYASERNFPALYNCIMGIHPTFEQALEKLASGKARAVSFNRDFALIRDFAFSDISIHYKGAAIGTYCPKTNKITLRRGPVMKLIKRKLDKIVGSAS